MFCTAVIIPATFRAELIDLRLHQPTAMVHALGVVRGLSRVLQRRHEGAQRRQNNQPYVKRAYSTITVSLIVDALRLKVTTMPISRYIPTSSTVGGDAGGGNGGLVASLKLSSIDADSMDDADSMCRLAALVNVDTW